MDSHGKCRAWRVAALGDPEYVLRQDDVSLPLPGVGDVLVEIHTASLNFADLLLCQGKYQANPILPFTPGLESFGRVLEVGPGSKLKVGQLVVATPPVPGGAFATMALLPERLTYSVPPQMDPIAASALLNSHITALLSLSRRAELRPGETVLVHAGAGAVGSAAIQVAKVLGAKVIATAGGEQKVEICRRLGAETAIDYLREDFVAVVRDVTDGRGADVILDPVGGDVFHRSRRCVALEGRIVIIGFTSGEIPSVSTNHPMLKLYSIIGSTVGIYREAMPSVWQNGVQQVFDMYSDGLIDPLIYRVLDFSEVPVGYGLLRDRLSWGKIVVDVRQARNTS